MFCPFCGESIPQEAQFCPYCGKAVVAHKSPIPEMTTAAVSLEDIQDKPLFVRFWTFQKGENANSIQSLTLKQEMKKAYFYFKLNRFLRSLITSLMVLIFVEGEGELWEKLRLMTGCALIIGIPMIPIDRYHKKMTGIGTLSSLEKAYKPYELLYGNKLGRINIVSTVFGVLYILYYWYLGAGIEEAFIQGALIETSTATTFCFFWVLKWWSLLALPVLVCLAVRLCCRVWRRTA